MKKSGIYTGLQPQTLANGRPIVTGDVVEIDTDGEDSYLVDQLAPAPRSTRAPKETSS